MRRIAAAFATAFVSLAFASPAVADPWHGGPDTVTSFEARTASILSEWVGRPVGVVCWSPSEWAEIGASFGFDPADVWGLVRPSTRANANMAPHTCSLAEGFMSNPVRLGQKECLVGTTVEYSTEYRVERYRVRIKIKRRWRYVWRTRSVGVEVAHEVPVYEPCPDWERKVFALQTFTHEAAHLAGVDDEALAECLAMQNLAWFAAKAGASAEFAREIALDFWAWYRRNRLGTSYGHPECRDGGALDLRPASPVWPKLNRYHVR